MMVAREWFEPGHPVEPGAPVQLADLLAGMVTLKPDDPAQPDDPVHSGDECLITGLCLDSRCVRPGDLFLACHGDRTDGRDYMQDAIDAGAVAVVWESGPARISTLDHPVEPDHLVELDHPVEPDHLVDPDHLAALDQLDHPGHPIIAVPRLRERVGEIAARFYGHPSREVRVVGITGTNGKTSCSWFLAQLLNEDAPCGLIGTLGYGLYNSLQAASHTTPDGITLQSLFAQLRVKGARHVIMEVSSHGLDQGRINGTAVDIAVFTNLSRDHLDYHPDMAAYGEAKRRLFTLPSIKHAIINSDDAYGRELLRSLAGDRSESSACSGLPGRSGSSGCSGSSDVASLGYGLLAPVQPGDPEQPDDPGSGAHTAMVIGSELCLDAEGIRMLVTTPWGEGRLYSPLLGRFNASNLLAVLATLLVLDWPLQRALDGLRRIDAVPGRMERFGGGPQQPLVVVDYAHTPDALQQVLLALREHLNRFTKMTQVTQGRLVCVFGCGGDRDRGKRSLMGGVAERLADQVIVTDDNPRSEAPGSIVADILAGMERPRSAVVVHDRGAAIKGAVQGAAAGDIVLVAGKGHEEYQQVVDKRLPFSDRSFVASLLAVDHPLGKGVR